MCGDSLWDTTNNADDQYGTRGTTLQVYQGTI